MKIYFIALKEYGSAITSENLFSKIILTPEKAIITKFINAWNTKKQFVSNALKNNTIVDKFPNAALMMLNLKAIEVSTKINNYFLILWDFGIFSCSFFIAFLKFEKF